MLHNITVHYQVLTITASSHGSACSQSHCQASPILETHVTTLISPEIHG